MLRDDSARKPRSRGFTDRACQGPWNPHLLDDVAYQTAPICDISVVELKSQVVSSRIGNDVSRIEQGHSSAGIRPDWDTENPR